MTWDAMSTSEGRVTGRVSVYGVNVVYPMIATLEWLTIECYCITICKLTTKERKTKPKKK